MSDDEQFDCPSDDLLFHFAGGLLDEVVRERIRAHLESCDACVRRVDWLQKDLLGSMGDAFDPEPSGTCSIATGDSIVNPPQRTHELEFGEGFDFSILEPSENPQALGRLGDLEILGVVGDGAMGIVLRAIEEPLQRTVAIKVLKRQLCTSGKARRRFIREARAAAGINHPNVVTIHAVNAKGPYPYLIMEFLAGGTLRDLIRREGCLPPLDVVRLTREIAVGLAAAHRQGVIHRDIKPGNILLQPGGVRVKISDFGLARAVMDNTDLTSQGQTVGTPAYMSPEQVAGRDVDHRTDLFSLGCVVYAMVAGDSPFRGGSQLETARRIASWEPPRLDEVVEGTPRFLVELTSKLLAKKPEDRFASAEEVADSLAKYLSLVNQTATDEMSAVLRTATPLPPRRSRLWWGLPAIAVLLAVAAGIWKVWPPVSGNGEPNPPPISRYPALLLVGGPAGSVDRVNTIGEALSLAGPGTRIRVFPDREYAESVVIADARRLAGVALEGAPGNRMPVLRGTNSQSPLIAIQGVCGVEIRGLDLRPIGGSGILIEGNVDGILIERVRCIEPSAGNDPALHMVVTGGSPQGPPITVRASHFDSPGPGQCLMIVGQNSGQTIVIENNDFVGRGVLVLATDALCDLTLRGNVFRTPHKPPTTETVPPMTVGLNLNLTELAGLRRCHVYNNTFLDVTAWLGLVFTDADRPAEIAVCNNLILGARSIQSEQGRLDSAFRNWRFEANWWEMDPSLAKQGQAWQQVAEVRDRIELMERKDPASPDFLQPPPDSPLLRAGIGTGVYPAHVGARGPRLATGPQRGTRAP